MTVFVVIGGVLLAGLFVAGVLWLCECLEASIDLEGGN